MRELFRSLFRRPLRQPVARRCPKLGLTSLESRDVPSSPAPYADAYRLTVPGSGAAFQAGSFLLVRDYDTSGPNGEAYWRGTIQFSYKGTTCVEEMRVRYFGPNGGTVHEPTGTLVYPTHWGADLDAGGDDDFEDNGYSNGAYFFDRSNSYTGFGSGVLSGLANRVNEDVPQAVTIEGVDLPDLSVVAGGPSATRVNQATAFSAAASDGAGYGYTYTWNFGDGTTGASGASPSHSYSKPGTYTATVRVTDRGGAAATAAVTVRVRDHVSVTSDARVAEGGTGKFVVSRLGTDGDLPVSLTLPTGTANPGDYQPLPTTVVIPAGQSSMSFSFHAKRDNLVESDETVRIGAVEGTAYTVGGDATITIADDPPVVTIAGSQDAWAFGTDGKSVPGRFALSRTGGDISAPLTVSVVFGSGPGLSQQWVDFGSANSTAFDSQVALVDLPITPLFSPTLQGDGLVQAIVAAGSYQGAGSAATIGLHGNHNPVANDFTVSVDPGSIDVSGGDLDIGSAVITYTQGASARIDVLSHSTDPDNTSLSIVSATGAHHGTLSVTDGLVVYTPSSPVWDFVDSFSYTVADGYGGVASATVSIVLEVRLGGAIEIGVNGDAGTQVFKDTDADELPVSPPPVSPPPVSPPAPPTSGALKKEDFQPKAKAPGAEEDAVTVYSRIANDGNVQARIKPTAARAPGGGFTVTSTAQLTAPPVFKAVFSAEDSWVNKDIVYSDNLFNHELMHLKLGEYVAAKATSNWVNIVGTGTSTNADVKAAAKAANAAANADFDTKYDAYIAKYKLIDDAVQKAYEDATDHSKKKDVQAQWMAESYWKPIVDGIITKNGWN